MEDVSRRLGPYFDILTGSKVEVWCLSRWFRLFLYQLRTSETGAFGANPKSECRNPKQIQNSNYQNQKPHSEADDHHNNRSEIYGTF